MKLLIVSPYYFPIPAWGARARCYYLLKMLARKHTISLLTIDDRAEIEAYYNTNQVEDLTDRIELLPRPEHHHKRLRQLMNVISRRSNVLDDHSVPGMQEALDALLARNDYDAVLFESALTASYHIPEDVKVILNQHNIEFELLERTYLHEKAGLRKWYNWWESRLLRSVELERCQKADVVLVTSERERLLLKSMLQRSVIEVVPNGVDIETFDRNCSEREVPSRIIFTGSMDYHPNIDGALFFAQKCWPRIRARIPDATWQIVGKNPPPEIRKLGELPGVTVTGSVPDVRPYFNQAMVAIAPLMIGSGTRLKILEALAMQKAVVSTSLGCEGISVVSGKHLIVVDQPDAFAQAVVELIKSSETRKALETAGRALVETEYSWERCGDQLLHVLEQI